MVAFQRALIVSLCLPISAASSFAKQADDPGKRPSPIIAALIDATNDADADVRLAALSVLVKQPRDESAVAAFRQRLDDDDVNVRLYALSGLVRSEGGTDEVLQLLVSLLAKPEMQKSASQHLKSLGESAVPALLQALQKDETKRFAIELLGELASGEQRDGAVASLVPFLQDDDVQVRLTTVRALALFLREKKQQTASRTSDSRVLTYYRALIRKYDENGDGSLTENEWVNMRENPTQADINHDGKVTAEELAARLRTASPKN